MAKQNSFFGYGFVLEKARIIQDDEGNFIRGMCAINIIRGVRDFGNNITNLKYDTPVIMTGNAEKIKEMATWNVFDMVEIKGSVTTKEINKKTTCKNCGESNTLQGNIVFINPIYLSKRESDLTEEQALELLKKRVEISNCATLIGTLCREPSTYRTPKGLQITQYQLAVNRKYRIKEDFAENRTDYPWVKSYGGIAEEDSKFLKMGSMVYVDGMLQTRKIDRTTVCEHCNEEYHWNDTAVEVVPYAVEYLQGYVLPEEYEKMEDQKNKEAADKILKDE